MNTERKFKTVAHDKERQDREKKGVAIKKKSKEKK